NEAGDRRVLQNPSTVVGKRPRVGLHGALRVGVAAEVQIRAADRLVADDRHQLLELTTIERLPAKAARLADLRPAPRERQLRLAQRDADPMRLVFGGIAEQPVHLRPQALLLESEGAPDVRRPPAVATRG